MAKPVTPLVGCDVFVVDRQSQVLLVRRADNGFWALPGGCQDLGETPLQGAVREVKEETGFDVRITRLLGVFSSKCYEYVNYPWKDNEFIHLLFAGEIVGGKAKHSIETTEIAFFSRAQLPPLSDGHDKRIEAGFVALGNSIFSPLFE